MFVLKISDRRSVQQITFSMQEVVPENTQNSLQADNQADMEQNEDVIITHLSFLHETVANNYFNYLLCWVLGASVGVCMNHLGLRVFCSCGRLARGKVQSRAWKMNDEYSPLIIASAAFGAKQNVFYYISSLCNRLAETSTVRHCTCSVSVYCR